MCSIIATVLLFAVSILFPSSSPAGEVAEQGFPSRPLTIIVPYTRGGGLDVSTRLVAKYAAPYLGQIIEVENITLGGNVRGYEMAVNAAPDGYTLAAWANGLVTDSLLVKNAPYKYTDIEPVCMFANDPHLIVINKAFAKDRGIESLEDLFGYMRVHPGRLSIGVGGNWTTHDFLRLKMERMAKVMFNRIPFLGGAPALRAVAKGNCNVATPFISELLGLEDRGEVLPLAVAYQERVAQFPNLPSVPELGYPGITQSIWRVFGVPKGTPVAIREILEKAFRKALDNSDFIDEAKELGVNPLFMSSGQLGLFIEKEYRFYTVRLSQVFGVEVGGEK